VGDNTKGMGLQDYLEGIDRVPVLNTSAMLIVPAICFWSGSSP
jgi:hypothetical protein